MRIFKTSPFGDEVDLDDSQTYDCLPNDLRMLDDLMFKEIGYALCYMDYFHSEIYSKEKSENSLINSCYLQRQRVNKLIKDFTDERKNHYTDVLWYQEQIFLFQDEIENMC